MLHDLSQYRLAPQITYSEGERADVYVTLVHIT
jgi:hypothetical protein